MDWKPLTDCQFYLESVCTNRMCTYRHLRGLKLKKVSVCRLWQSYECFDIHCSFQHPSSVENYATHESSSQGIISTRIVEKSDDGMLTTGGERSENDEDVGIAEAETCLYFMKGRCRAGDSCRFKHGLPRVTFKRHREDLSRPGPSKEEVDGLGLGKDILTKYSLHKFVQETTSSLETEQRAHKSHKLEHR